jgi:hypothetical protein
VSGNNVAFLTGDSSQNATFDGDIIIKVGSANYGQLTANIGNGSFDEFATTLDGGITVYNSSVTTRVVNMGVNSSGEAYIQAREPGSATSRELFLQPNAGQVRVGGNLKVNTDFEVIDGKVIITDSANEDGLRVNMSNASLTGTAEVISATRASNSAFNLLTAFANGTADLKWKVRGDGEVTADGSFTGGGAGYQIVLEWKDGNPDSEDRIGWSVILEENSNGQFIRKTRDGEIADGVISATSAFVENDSPMKYHKKHKRDKYKRTLTEPYKQIEWVEIVVAPIAAIPVQHDEHGFTTHEATPAIKGVYHLHSYQLDRIPNGLTPPDDATIISDDEYGPLLREQLHPDYDSSLPYIRRSERTEWDKVEIIGICIVRDDQIIPSHWKKLQSLSNNVSEYFVSPAGIR